MKTIIIMLLSVTLCFGASAQRKGYYPYRPVYRSRVYIAPFSYGFGYGYPLLGYPYYGYPYAYREIPSKLSLKIEAIKIDYQNRIREARKDKSLSHSQRRQEIRNLKTQRDEDIINAKMNYARPMKRDNRNPALNNQQDNDNAPPRDNS